MWKSVVGHNVNTKVAAEGDDWETDPDFENDISEQEQRWGAKTIEGSGRKEHISVADLRHNVVVEHEKVKQKEHIPKASYGYGGKFGVENDRMDKVAVGHDYIAQVEQHSSQKDAARGFGGKFGVQKDRVDKSAMGFEYKGEVQQHTSQKDYSKGFGGKYGVEKDKVDQAALGYNYKGETEKHQSQKDYSKGFGGKYGVEKDKVDKAALGYDYKSETEKHQSQKDYSAGFGGQYGVQKDRMDKSAAGYSDIDSPTSAYERTVPVETSSVGAGKLKARFEGMAKAADDERKRKADEERAKRQARETKEKEEAKLREQEMSSREEKCPPPQASDVYATEQCEDLYTHDPKIEEAPEDESLYEEPPELPARGEDFLDAPPVPQRTAEVDVDEDDDDDGDYDDLAGPQPPPQISEEGDNDYEDLTCGLRAKAIYDYQGEADDEISFFPDDIITNVEMIDEGWWKGQCHGRLGLFPAAYVELL